MSPTQILKNLFYLLETILIILAAFICASFFNPIQVNATLEPNYRVIWPQENLTPQEKIKLVCEVYGCDSSQLLRIAKCESNFQNIPNSTGSGAFGPFQFMEPTFRSFAKKYLDLNTNRADWQNPDLQYVVAGIAIKNGQAYHWECK